MKKFAISLPLFALALNVACAGTVPVDVAPGGYDVPADAPVTTDVVRAPETRVETVYVLQDPIVVHDTTTIYVPVAAAAPTVFGTAALTSALHAKDSFPFPQGGFGNIGTVQVCTSAPTLTGATVHTLETQIVGSPIGTNIRECHTHGWPATESCMATAIPNMMDGKARFFLDNCDIPPAAPDAAQRCVLIDVDCGIAADAPIGATFTLADITPETAAETIVTVNDDVIAMTAGANDPHKPVASIVPAIVPPPVPAPPAYTIALVAAPTTALSNATMALLRFTVAASAAADFSFSSVTSTLTQEIAASGVVLRAMGGTSSVRRVGDAINISGNGSLLDADGYTCSSDGAPCVFTAVFSEPQVVAAGTSRTYDVRISVDGSVTDEDHVEMSLPTVQ